MSTGHLLELHIIFGKKLNKTFVEISFVLIFKLTRNHYHNIS